MPAGFSIFIIHWEEPEHTAWGGWNWQELVNLGYFGFSLDQPVFLFKLNICFDFADTHEKKC